MNVIKSRNLNVSIVINRFIASGIAGHIRIDANLNKAEYVN